MKRSLLLPAVLVLAGLLLGGIAWAQTSPSFDLHWHVMSGGGRDDMASTSFRLHGTLGQVAIGPAQGTTMDVGSGYWYGVRRAKTLVSKVYLPIVIK